MDVLRESAKTPIGDGNGRRWQAVVRNDTAADGYFFYAVKTTGIYCRPSCRSRRPRRENVLFYRTPAAAERAGYRPCKRCRPDRVPPGATRIARACRLIEASPTPPATADLAARVGLSRHHLHRLFKRVTGLTPRQYAIAQRDARLRKSLVGGASVTRAMHDSGFASSGHFYGHAERALGMTPSRYREGGVDCCIRFAVGESLLGTILVAGTERGVCDIALGGDPETLVRVLQDRFPQARLVGGDHDFERHVAAVVGFVQTPGIGLDLPLDIQGTAFQQRVWQALGDIPMGETASYAQIAARIGSPRAVRAVAGACAANRLALAIPCHRVVRTDGALSGYRWGVARKQQMLEREAVSDPAAPDGRPSPPRRAIKSENGRRVNSGKGKNIPGS